MESLTRPLMVIDTDVGSDDALALLLALYNLEWDIAAITTVHGNVDVEQASENVLRILEFCGKSNIPTYQGCNSALVESVPTDYYHGKDGLGGYSSQLPNPTSKIRGEPAAVALVQLARKHYKRISLIALGPLTNVALAHRLDPAFSSNLKELYIMGGNIEGKGNVTASTEFNFNSDPEAADITLREFNCLMTILTWEVSAAHLMSWEWYDKWISLGTRVSEFIANVTKSAVHNCRHLTKRGGFHCCDLLAMTALLHPGVVTKQVTRPVHIELQGRHTRGMMIPDWRPHSPYPHNATICMELDLEEIREIWDKIAE